MNAMIIVILMFLAFIAFFPLIMFLLFELLEACEFIVRMFFSGLWDWQDNIIHKLDKKFFLR